MTLRSLTFFSAALIALALVTPVQAENCQQFGPQTPRDITDKAGTNPVVFSFAPDHTKLNLCDIHFHRNAEHKGPGFSEFAGEDTFGGFRCNESRETAKEAMEPLAENHCKHLNTGDTIEVHWVFTSCDVEPGPGLGSCLPDRCPNPQLRVETQVFQTVNDRNARDFGDFDYAGKPDPGGYHQPKSLPEGTGDPVRFLGSTTGTDFDNQTCSPLTVTWSVRPECTPIDIKSVSDWCRDDDIFDEKKAHGVRQLVTDPALLSKIE